MVHFALCALCALCLFSCTETDHKQRKPLWTELLPKRLAQMLQYFLFFYQIWMAFHFSRRKEKTALRAEKMFLLNLLGFNKSLAGLWSALKKPGGSLEPLLIAFNMMLSLSFSRNASAAFCLPFFRRTGINSAQLLYQVKPFELFICWGAVLSSQKENIVTITI